ncbi:MAG TPA: polysaccharide biosynthesis/export family protein [Vicinamibacteria bacterium]|jgi:polysaccharide export outer membrane protein
MRTRASGLASSSIALLCACAHSGPYVWVQDYAKADPPAASTYAIQDGDLIRIQVWNQDAMSTRARVRSDGQISVPFLKDVAVAGKTPSALATELEGMFKDYVNHPVVYVVVEESKPATVSVIGEVTRPGVYPLDAGGGVAPALAAAGGLTAFAHKTRIFVLRAGSPPSRIRFTYDALIDGTGPASAFRLSAGDVVVVE